MTWRQAKGAPRRWELTRGGRIVAVVFPWVLQVRVGLPDEVVEAVIELLEPGVPDDPDAPDPRTVEAFVCAGNLAEAREAAERIIAINSGEGDPATPPLNVRPCNLSAGEES